MHLIIMIKNKILILLPLLCLTLATTAFATDNNKQPYEPNGQFNTIVDEGYSDTLLRYYYKKAKNSVEDFYHYEFLARSIPGIYFLYFLEPNFKYSDKTTFDLHRYTYKNKISGNISTNNLGTNLTGRQFFVAEMNINGLSGNDQLKIGAGTTSKSHKSIFYLMQYKDQISEHGLQIIGDYSYNYIKSGDIGRYNSTVNSREFEVSLFQPFWINQYNQLGVVAGYAFTFSSNNSDALGSFSNLTVRQKLPFVFIITNWSHHSSKAVYHTSIELAQGSHFLGPNRNETTGQTESEISASIPAFTFTRLTFNFKANFTLPHNFNISFESQAQKLLSHGTLFLSQKMYSGDGAYIGQGYLGDEGIALKTEINYTMLPKQKYFATPQFYSFLYTAHLHNFKQAVVNYNSASPASFGVGVRGSLFNYIQSFWELSYPMGTRLSVDHNHDWQFFFGLSKNF